MTSPPILACQIAVFGPSGDGQMHVKAEAVESVTSVGRGLARVRTMSGDVFTVASDAAEVARMIWRLP